MRFWLLKMRRLFTYCRLCLRLQYAWKIHCLWKDNIVWINRQHRFCAIFTNLVIFKQNLIVAIIFRASFLLNYHSLLVAVTPLANFFFRRLDNRGLDNPGYTTTEKPGVIWCVPLSLLSSIKARLLINFLSNNIFIVTVFVLSCAPLADFYKGFLRWQPSQIILLLASCVPQVDIPAV